jgi:SAM-dependent methyltransferase
MTVDARRSRGDIRAWAERSYVTAMAHNTANITNLLAADPGRRLLDLGCDDGARTLEFAAAAGASVIHGIEMVSERARLAAARGVNVCEGDLNDLLTYDDGSFDIVCSNQVIEHVRDTDQFVAETRRLLAVGGYTIASTENLASWHNVGALIFGWQPFSLTNVSAQRLGIGNPIGVHRGEDEHRGESWQHQRVFAYRGLAELYEAHGFRVEAVLGAGYYPLPSRVANIDPRHAAFLTVKARRVA